MDEFEFFFRVPCMCVFFAATPQIWAVAGYNLRLSNFKGLRRYYRLSKCHECRTCQCVFYGGLWRLLNFGGLRLHC